MDIITTIKQPGQAIKDCRNCKFGDYNDHWNTNFCYCSDDCNNLDKWEPSAQPEIIRCKDCKHKPTGSGINHDIKFPDQDYRCPCRCEDYWYSWIPDDDWFCANGERREE